MLTLPSNTSKTSNSFSSDFYNMDSADSRGGLDDIIGTSSFCGVAEKKLQLSLDELIELQQRKEKASDSKPPVKNSSLQSQRYKRSGLSNSTHDTNTVLREQNTFKHRLRARPYQSNLSVHIPDSIYGLNGPSAATHIPYNLYSLNPPFFARSVPSNEFIHTSSARHNNGRSFVFNHSSKQAGMSVAALTELAVAEVEILYPPLDPETNSVSTEYSLIVKFKETEILKVGKAKGNIILNSGGWRTMSTRSILNCALKPIGLRVELSSEINQQQCQGTKKTTPSNKTFDPNEWFVTDGMAYLALFQDQMVIGQIGSGSHSHLLARSSVISQHLKQAKNSALARRGKNRYNL